ncbi:MAG: hypothetical protein AAF587_02870 [Bacteroidota bacterium]
MRKALHLLRKLSVEDRQCFHRWVITELHGRQAAVRQMVEMILESLEQERIPIDEELWQKVFDDKPFDAQELGRKYGQLLIQLEEFLAIQAFRKDRLLRDRMLLRRLNELPLGNEFLKYANKIRRRFKQSGLRDKNYFQSLFALEGELMQHMMVQNVSPRKRPYASYKEAFLAWWCQLFMDQRVIEKGSGRKPQTEWAKTWENQLTDLIHEFEQHRQYPVLSLQVKLEQILDGEEGELYAFQDLILDHEHALPWDTRYNLIAILQSYLSVKQRETREIRYFFNRIKLEQMAIERGWFFVGNYLPSKAYNNYISIRLRCLFLISKRERSVWLEETWEFLDTYKSSLAPFEQAEIYEFNRMKLHFFSGELEKVLRRRKYDMYSRANVEIETRLLILMARYERVDVYGIEANIDSLWQYIYIQKSLKSSYKKMQFEHLRILRRMLKVKQQQQWEPLKEQVSKLAESLVTLWFQRQIDQHL